MTMARATGLTKRLGLTHPIVQAPMAGGGDTPRLVAAVSEAGAFGSIGAAHLTPQQIVDSAKAPRALPPPPFGVDPFPPVRIPSPGRDVRPAPHPPGPPFSALR